LTNEKSCILASRCKIAGSEQCTRQCPHAIAMHGLSGVGGRSASANVPADYRLVTVENSPARDSQAVVYKAMDAYVKTYDRQFDENGERIKSLYLWSANTGTGKSTTASAALNTYLITHYLGSIKRGNQALQNPAYFLSVNNLQQTHNKTHLPASLATKERLGEELIREIERAKNTPFLVMDDMAVRKATTSFAGILYDICDYRTSNRLTTIYTSNKSLDDLREFFIDEDPEGKIVDRISDMAAVLEFSGDSKRGMRR
jgi:DNA replication protein DnaC